MGKRVSKNGPGVIGPTAARKIHDGKAAGLNSTAIAKIIGVTRQAVEAYLKRHRPRQPSSTSLQPIDPAVSVGLPMTGSGGPAEEPIVDLARGVAEARQNDATTNYDASDEAGTGAVDVARRLERATKLLDDLEPGLLAGDVPAATFVQLGKFEAELAERVEAMKPVPPPDPEHDPVNIEATRRVVAKVRRAVEVAEAAARCVHCGNNPFAKGA